MKAQAAASAGRTPPAGYFLEPALRRAVFFFAARRAGFLAPFFLLRFAAGRVFFAALAFLAGAFFAGRFAGAAALAAGARSYRHVDSILKHGLDRVGLEFANSRADSWVGQGCVAPGA